MVVLVVVLVVVEGRRLRGTDASSGLYNSDLCHVMIPRGHFKVEWEAIVFVDRT